MRLSSHRVSRNRSLVLDLTSMIDVVFLLLIFFMINLSFLMTERELPAAARVDAASPTATAEDFEPAIVEVLPGPGGGVFRVGGRDLATRRDLTELLRQFPAKEDGAFVRVADDAPWRLGAEAMQAAHDAGFRGVTYLPTRGPR